MAILITVLVLVLSVLGMAFSSTSGDANDAAFIANEAATAPMMAGGASVRQHAAPMMAKRSAPMASVAMDAAAPPEMMMAGSPAAASAPGAFASFAAGAMPSAEGQQADTSFAPLYGEQVLIKEAFVSAETRELDKAVSLVLKIVAGIKGEVESSNVNHAQQPGEGEEDGISMHQWRPPSTADIRAKVPAKALDGFLDQLRAALTTTPLGDSQSLAKILSESQNARDASAEYVDAATRERVEMASLETLKQLLERATSVQDVLSIRREMMMTTEKIESARSQRKSLEGRAAMSLVSINLQTPQWRPPRPKPRPGWSVMNSAGQAVKALMRVAEGTIDVLIFAAVFAVPTLLGVAALVFVLRLLLPLIPWRKIMGGFVFPSASAFAAVASDGGSAASSSSSAPGSGASRRTE